MAHGSRVSRIAVGLLVVLGSPAIAAAARADTAANDAELVLVVQRDARQLLVKRGSHTLRVMKAAVGKESTPTPTGVAVVLDIRRPQNPTVSSPLGPFTLRLDAKSSLIPDYAIDGWPGIVIQGTNCPKTCLGKAVTNGSIRVSNANVTWLARHVPVGTAVEIL